MNYSQVYIKVDRPHIEMMVTQYTENGYFDEEIDDAQDVDIGGNVHDTDTVW